MFTPLVYHREDAITPKEGLRSCNPMVVDDAGQAVRMVGTGQDITEHTREQLVPFEATYAPGTWTSTT